ncbi:MAG: EVE domain-containing protein [Algoriphagus sp.]
MNYWLVKTEPSTYSWDDLRKKGTDTWDGIRNFQARNYLKQMKVGDGVLVYHSGQDKSIQGLAEVLEEAFDDPQDAAWVAVRLKALRPLTRPIPLSTIQSQPKLSQISLLKQSRLSVHALSKDEGELLLEMGS